MSAPVDSNSDAKKRIVILKATPASLFSAESFLKNRSWQVTSVMELKQILALALAKKVDYVFLSVDHASPKVSLLPKLLSQAVGIPVVIFGEGLSARGNQAIRESNHPYVLNPPVSGPAIERIILRIERDLTKERDGEKAHGDPTLTEKSGEDSVLTFSNKSVLNNGSVAVMKGSALEALNSLLNGEGTERGGATEQDPGGSGFSFNNGGNNSDNGFGTSQSGQDDNGHNLLNQNGAGGANGLGQSNGSDVGGGSGLGQPNRTGAGGGNGLGQSNGTDASGDNGIGGRAKSKNTPSFEQEHVDKKAGAKFGAGVTNKNFRSADQFSLISASEHAINELVYVPSGTQSTDKREIILSCFRVAYADVSGHVLVAVRSHGEDHTEMMEKVREKVLSYLKTLGYDINSSYLIPMQLNNVDVEPWLMEQAEFLRSSMGDGLDISLAFIDGSPAPKDLEVSAQKDMRKISIDELRADVKLEFDLFIWMPLNKKYVRYSKKNLPVMNKQLERLKSGGVQDLHVREESQADVHRYHVQNFLNDSIAQFRAREAS